MRAHYAHTAKALDVQVEPGTEFWGWGGCTLGARPAPILHAMTLFCKDASYERISKEDEGDEDGVIRQGEDPTELGERSGVPLQRRRFRDNDKSATRGKHRPSRTSSS